MPMDSEMNDISLSDFTPYTIVASLEMSDEPFFFLFFFDATKRLFLFNIFSYIIHNI